MMSSAAEVSAVVVARNREAVMRRCLRAIQATGVAEIIVVDGASTDRTRHIAREEGARVLTDGGAGLGAARQLGAEAARSSWIVYVDSDSVLRPDTVGNLLEEARIGQFDAVQALLLALPGQTTSYWQRGELWRRRLQESPGVALAIGCQATLIRRAVFEHTHFDEAFSGAGEDGDFFRRAYARGAKIAFGRTAIAYHWDRAGLFDFVQQRIWHGRGLARTALRYREEYWGSAGQHGARLRMPVHSVVRYLPFLAVSTVALAWGMALETLRLAKDSGLRAALRATRS